MDESRLRDSLQRFAERADRSDEAAAPIVKKARLRIVRNSLGMALMILMVVAAGVFAGTQLTQDRGLPPVNPPDETEGSYEIRQSARDGAVSFYLAHAECAEEDGEDLWCVFHLRITNHGDEEVEPLDPRWQVLRLDGGATRLPDEDRMQAYGEDFFTNRTPFNLPIPPGEEMPAVLIYSDVPEESMPAALELHSAETSRGVVVSLPSLRAPSEDAPADDGGEPVTDVLVAKGGGGSWSMYAGLSKDGETLCLSLGGTVCTVANLRSGFVPLTSYGYPEEQGFIYGPVAEDVATLSLVTDKDAIVLRLRDFPEGLGVDDLRFYAHPVRGQGRGMIVARDVQGNLLQERAVAWGDSSP